MPLETKNNAVPALQVKLIPVNDLLLDPRNPRLALMGLGGKATQAEILEALWRNMAVDEVAYSIANNGYFPHEPLFAEQESDGLVVIEGNRRLAAVKLLLDVGLRRKLKATDLPEITEDRRLALQQLPVIECSRAQVWQYLGFKHVNGPQPWDPYSKAEYIARVHNQFKIPLTEIARTIGDLHATVRRLYRGLIVLGQAEKAGVFDREDRWTKHFSFSHLYTGLDYPGFQAFLGIDPAKSFQPEPVPEQKLANLKELCEWLYGSRSRDKQPLIRSQNPDLKLLEEVLQSSDGLSALRKGMPLGTSVNISRGDERLFRGSMVAAKQNLEEARGKLLTGYQGEPDLLKIADAIEELAKDIHKAMKKKSKSLVSKWDIGV